MIVINTKFHGDFCNLIKCTGYFPSLGETEENRRDLYYYSEEFANCWTDEALIDGRFDDYSVWQKVYDWTHDNSHVFIESHRPDDLATVAVDGIHVDTLDLPTLNIQRY